MNFSLSAEEKKLLLSTARESVAARLEGRRPARCEIPPGESSLNYPCGAFVTIHKQAQLRGCIGRMSAAGPLLDTVKAMALEAAFGDPRFPPLNSAEFPLCHFEISALSPMEKCFNPREVKVGVHGLYLSRQGRSGVLLPQVPVEQGWDLDEYLDYICIKAGLSPHSYDAPDASLYTFTAIVFGEET
ncbi:MAG: AmmeMemoRadiSam system protein A [Treponema sp.]|jgi:AmmeMemoRadiSam system protein A|nr:AmmeMemoRadiSam system protein A [Treponema sp.]